ncbi:MAG: HAD-IA family hydrolase [Clostridia bacterium]|nr:HAD-IA family hydrolase [Clostridia bacterium]MBR1683950.1 HAD-IA family hydrolase [Clostridia bacterium]
MKKKGLLLGTEGVLCSTLPLHRQAWETVLTLNQLSTEGISGMDAMTLSRPEGLDGLLAQSGTELSEAERELLVNEKNNQYRQLLANIDASSLLPGVESLLYDLRGEGWALCLVTRSKNAILILRQLGLDAAFDAVCDGNDQLREERYLYASHFLDLPPQKCVVWENIPAHLEEARKAGFQTVRGNAEDVRRQLLQAV